VLACDACMFCCVIGMCSLNFGGLTTLVFVAIALPVARFSKPLMSTLSARQKKMRFRATFGGYLLLIGLLLTWVLRHNSGFAWGVGSMATIVLLALLYADWDKLNDELNSGSSQSNAANHVPDPTSPSVTPPAGAGGAPSVAADH
jgi:hypothetical protein